MRISIFGFGDFGQLITKYLSAHSEVVVYNRNDAKTELIESFGAKPVSLEEAAGAEIVILAVTLESLEETLKAIAPYTIPGSLVADVTSVKVKPAAMMQELLPDHCQILATHPLFGPVSANDSLAGHKIVIDPIRVDDEAGIEKFLTDLDLEVIHMTCDEHDKEMAWVHALTFFVGRGLLNINPPTSPLTTHYYNELLDVVDVERTHSMELFYTIQRGNPYAEDMRKKLIDSLTILEVDIQKEN
jgi:prephenate dehydrogenase